MQFKRGWLLCGIFARRPPCGGRGGSRKDAKGRQMAQRYFVGKRSLRETREKETVKE
jgi:hypothetical protein